MRLDPDGSSEIQRVLTDEGRIAGIVVSDRVFTAYQRRVRSDDGALQGSVSSALCSESDPVGSPLAGEVWNQTY
ncbi:hypothetical protein [Microbacterium sp. OR16]|uniref:hypothetical protein n=1 Tax=Microbacterium sp. OR16 TaxID=3095345 RepID=UPI0039B57E4B